MSMWQANEFVLKYMNIVHIYGNMVLILHKVLTVIKY